MQREEIVEDIIRRALAEDLCEAGDVTSLSTFCDSDNAEAVIRAKEAGIISGVSVIEPVFRQIDKRVSVELKLEDGASVSPGDEICRVKGPIIAVLSGERLALNLLQHMSGVASATKRLTSIVEKTGSKSRVLDTRKTTPNLRILEKEAVLHGGGTNHRIGLYDMILIKDTHVKAAGGPDKAVMSAKSWCDKHSKDLKIEVEVEGLEHFELALPAAPDRIMLDNMSCEDMSKAVSKRNSEAPSIELEASGNVNESTIADIARTNVDFISVGAITHSVKALDIHLVLV